MKETTAEIWIAPDQSKGWYSTNGGLNPTHLMLLRENDYPAWLLLPGNLHDSNVELKGPHPVWVPTRRALEDALLMFAVIKLEIPSVCEMFEQLGGARKRDQLNLDSLFLDGVPETLYQECKTQLQNLHVVISANDRSLARGNCSAMASYTGLNMDVRLTAPEFSGQSTLDH